MFEGGSMKRFFSSQIKNQATRSLFWDLIKHTTLHRAYYSIMALAIWQTRKNRAAVYGCDQFWYSGPYRRRLWRGRHLTQHQRLLGKNEKGGKDEKGGKLPDVSQHETRGQIQRHHHQLPKGAPRTQNGLIIALCGWWCCFVAPKTNYKVTPNPENTRFGRLLWSLLAWCKDNTSHAFTAMWLSKSRSCSRPLICIHRECI